MIEFFQQTDFELENKDSRLEWISKVIDTQEKELGEIAFIFCSDEYLLDLNQKFLDHDTLTDIISFDDSMGDLLQGEIYISIDRVRENAVEFNTSFENELDRVIIHGILHFCGYKDKTEQEAAAMRSAENKALKMRN